MCRAPLKFVMFSKEIGPFFVVFVLKILAQRALKRGPVGPSWPASPAQISAHLFLGNPYARGARADFRVFSAVFRRDFSRFHFLFFGKPPKGLPFFSFYIEMRASPSFHTGLLSSLRSDRNPFFFFQKIKNPDGFFIFFTWIYYENMKSPLNGALLILWSNINPLRGDLYCFYYLEL